MKAILTSEKPLLISKVVQVSSSYTCIHSCTICMNCMFHMDVIIGIEILSADYYLTSLSDYDIVRCSRVCTDYFLAGPFQPDMSSL